MNVILFNFAFSIFNSQRAKVAQLVERVSEKHEIAEPCPVLGTKPRLTSEGKTREVGLGYAVSMSRVVIPRATPGRMDSHCCMLWPTNLCVLQRRHLDGARANLSAHTETLNYTVRHGTTNDRSSLLRS